MLNAASHADPSVGSVATLRAGLALCAAILAGTPARLSRLRQLDAQSDAELVGHGRTRDAETRRVFADWFGF